MVGRHKLASDKYVVVNTVYVYVRYYALIVLFHNHTRPAGNLSRGRGLFVEIALPLCGGSPFLPSPLDSARGDG